MFPYARQDKLVVQELGDETIIYDEERNHVHRLNRTAALVWRACDGKTSVTDLVNILQPELGASATEDVVWLALDRLEKERLLSEKLVRPEDSQFVTRRQMLKKAALVGGMTLMLPVVQSIVAPTPAMALSIGCAKRGQTYSVTRPCCAGLQPIRGKCADRAGNF